LGVLGLTAHSSEMPGEGVDMGQRVYVHHLTLTKPAAMSKDIATRTLRVGPREPTGADRCRPVPTGADRCRPVPTGADRCRPVPTGADWCRKLAPASVFAGTPNASSATTH
jgi:hypothetical protein